MVPTGKHQKKAKRDNEMKSGDLFSQSLAGLFLICSFPLVAVCALIIFLGDRGPILFRQCRIGKNGKPFLLLKLRTMKASSNIGNLTSRGDTRITRVGGLLRQYKFDEIPQLLNVFRGEMSFVGPRPEVPEYVNLLDPRWQAVLSVRPGIVDLASLAFRNEEDLLSQQTDIETFYREWLLPRKLDLSAHYIRSRSPRMDARLIALTFRHVTLKGGLDPQKLAKQFAYEGAL
jgi:lipopolysaccharide/colanic/teichoic acid biosynthesis glycosyltransferase